MTENLEFTIQNKKQLGNEIQNITAKNTAKFWRTLGPTKEIVIYTKLKQPSYVTRVELRGYQTDIIDIQFKDMDGDSIKSLRILFQNLKQLTTVKNVQVSQMVQFVDITLTSSNGSEKFMGLNYFFLKGQKDAVKMTKQRITNLTKQHNIDQMRVDTINGPAKSRPVQTSRPYVNLVQTKKIQNYIFDQRQKRNVVKKDDKQMQQPQKCEDQLQRALKQSQKTFQQQQRLKISRKEQFNPNNTQLNKSQQIQLDMDRQSDTKLIVHERNYQVAPLGQMMDCLKFVNLKWLEAQKVAENQAGVRQEQRLSNFVKIRHLATRKVYVDSSVIMGQRKARIQSVAESLGAVVLRKPVNYCIVVSNSFQNMSIQKIIKEFQGVKVVNEDYINDCMKVNADLDWKKYSLKK